MQEEVFSSLIRVTVSSTIPSLPEIPSEGRDLCEERFQDSILKLFMRHPGNKNHWRYRVPSLRSGLQKKRRYSGGNIPTGDTSSIQDG
jgi:hypothetical protein